MERFAQIVVVVGKAVQEVGCEVTNHATHHVTHHPCRCSEHKMIGPEITHQSYAHAMRSFVTAQQTTVSCLISLAVHVIVVLLHNLN